MSIVIPVYNEEEIIEELYKRLEGLKKLLLEKIAISEKELEIIFVNDGSSDKTFHMLGKLVEENESYRMINFSRNYGHQIAITAGMEHALGEAVVIIDSDLQDPPEFIIELYKKFLEGYDVVYAVRKKRKGESWVKLFTAKAFYLLLKKIAHIDIPVDTGDFRLISRRVVTGLMKMEERHRFIRGMVSWVGYRQTGIEYEREERFAGSTKYPFKKMLSFALDGITSFTNFPLKLSTYFGFTAAFLSFIYALYAVYLKVIAHRTVQGWTSLMVVVLFLGGVQLFSIGVIGEYLARINDEVKKRPLYLVEGIYGISEK